jgi:hypothetical protein
VAVSYEPFDRFSLNAAFKAQKSSTALYTIARANKEAAKPCYITHLITVTSADSIDKAKECQLTQQYFSNHSQ